MIVRLLIFTVVAFLIAGGVGFVILEVIPREQETIVQQSEPEIIEIPASTSQILVANRALGVGQFLSVGDFSWQEWPDSALTGRMIVDDGVVNLDDFSGSVARRAIESQEAISPGMLVQPGERGFLAAVLAPGARAITIDVDRTSASGGLLQPGDRVDLILTQQISDELASSQFFTSETIMENIRVIAVGQSLNQIEPDGDVARTVTLEASQLQAEAIAMSGRMGAITLVMRSLAIEDGSGSGAEIATLPTLIEQAADAGGDTLGFIRSSDVSRALTPPQRTVTIITPDNTTIVPVSDLDPGDALGPAQGSEPPPGDVDNPEATFPPQSDVGS